MTRILILLFALCYSMKVEADLPGPAFQYDRYSENGRFYFKSIPFYNYDQTNFGKTLVFESETQKEIYKIDNYLPTESFISNTGRTLVTTTYWMWGHSDFEQQKLIEIFIDGKSSIKYYLDDLVSDQSMLIQTSSHTLWYKKMFVNNDTLSILTLEEKVIRIEFGTGKIIDRINKDDCLKCNNIDNISQPKLVYYRDIKYPERAIFPDLIDGNKFRESLITGLNKTEVKEYSDCKYSVMVYGAIDKLGNCEIFLLIAYVDKKENEEWKKEVSNWVTTRKYKTDLIPQNCDKWVFQEYFYLK